MKPFSFRCEINNFLLVPAMKEDLGTIVLVLLVSSFVRSFISGLFAMKCLFAQKCQFIQSEGERQRVNLHLGNFQEYRHRKYFIQNYIQL